MSNLFALPVPVTKRSRNGTDTVSKKRKRTEKPQDEQRDDHSDKDQDGTPNLDEYRAVLGPDERSQRRRAGLSLEEPIPAFPFPHKDTAVQKKKRESASQTQNADASSLRMQHISCMTAVLHRSIREGDWSRARRALGLLMRTEINGQPVDIRQGEHWGLGAEILFRHQPDHGKRWSRRGFEDAKEYYEKLIVRFPYHRASSDSVNAIDFYLALFSLWIYVAQAERASSSSADDSLDHDDVGRELEEAGLILARLTKCMSTAPYADNEDFKKLKSHVTQWHDNLESEYRFDSPMSPAYNSPGADLSAVAERLSL